MGLQNAYKLKSGYSWGSGSVNISYSFLTAVPAYYPVNADERDNFSQFTSEMEDLARSVLDEIESFTDITFTEVSGVGDITFGRADLPGAAGWAYLPGGSVFGGDVWIDNNFTSFYLFAHEIGHALGLDHTFEVGLTGLENTGQYSVMAYDQVLGNGTPSSYMLYDIAALQSLYGADVTSTSGNQTYAITSGERRTVWDASGNDTLDLSSVTSDSIVVLEAGEYSSIGAINNFTIAYGTTIENVMGGSGNDKIYGNNANNILMGGLGSDRLYGSRGNDILDGGAGTDRADYDYNSGDFSFSIVDSVTFALTHLTQNFTDTVTNIEKFIFDDVTYTFGEIWTLLAHSVIEGDAGDNMLTGTDGIDHIYGYAGDDEINAGLGNDLIYGGDDRDSIYALDGDDILYGEAGDDRMLHGGKGDDVLIGGAGRDVLRGASGSDTFKFENANDGRDIIRDFKLVKHDDKLDISDILTGFDPMADALTDFVRIAERKGHSYFKVDVDGGADGFVTLARLANATGLTDEQALFDSGNLII